MSATKKPWIKRVIQRALDIISFFIGRAFKKMKTDGREKNEVLGAYHFLENFLNEYADYMAQKYTGDELNERDF